MAVVHVDTPVVVCPTGLADDQGPASIADRKVASQALAHGTGGDAFVGLRRGGACQKKA